MTEEQKQILLKDLCARLPYFPWVQIELQGKEKAVYDRLRLSPYTITQVMQGHWIARPYLRPMEDMNPEELREGEKIQTLKAYEVREDMVYSPHEELVDWYNEHNFDWRGLIPQDLALPAEEGLYKL